MSGITNYSYLPALQGGCYPGLSVDHEFPPSRSELGSTAMTTHNMN
jgi:hypothetical protein